MNPTNPIIKQKKKFFRKLKFFAQDPSSENPLYFCDPEWKLAFNQTQQEWVYEFKGKLKESPNVEGWEKYLNSKRDRYYYWARGLSQYQVPIPKQ